MTTSRRRSTQEVRSAIVRAAYKEFDDRGYAGATMRDVAERAGVSLSVTHRHYKSKSRLFASALLTPFTEFLREFITTWTDATESARDDEEVLHEFVGELYRQLSAHRAALIGLLSVTEEGQDEIVGEFREALAEVFLELDAIGEEAAVGRAWLPSDAAIRGERLTMLLVIGAVFARDWFPGIETGGRVGDDDQFVSDLTKFVLYGLRQSPADGSRR